MYPGLVNCAPEQSQTVRRVVDGSEPGIEMQKKNMSVHFSFPYQNNNYFSHQYVQVTSLGSQWFASCRSHIYNCKAIKWRGILLVRLVGITFQLAQLPYIGLSMPRLVISSVVKPGTWHCYCSKRSQLWCREEAW